MWGQGRHEGRRIGKSPRRAMALRQKLEIRQGQSLVMTPQMQQAIKLLQMSNLELQAFVEAELERNPLLERELAEEPENRRREPDEAPREPAEEQSAGAEQAERPDLSEAMSAPADVGERLAEMGADATEMFASDGPADAPSAALGAGPAAGMRGGGGRLAEGEGRGLEETLSSETTLAQHLEAQLPLLLEEPAERLVGHHLIGLLDDDGYLREPLEAVAEQLGARQEAVERVLRKMQAMDPPGVFARDLAECLKLQLQEKDRFDPAMEALVDNLELLARRDFDRLCRICGVGQEDLADMLAEIRALNPRPGGAIGPLVVQPVEPDVFVRAAPDGSWIVELNSETLPRVLIDNQYYATVKASATREEDREYISSCLASANWLVKSLDQRARTILAVAREIVRQQDAFLTRGVEALRPLTLRQVAEAIGMHESTVSRVTSNKFMATPRGTFELKYFFTTAIASSAGGEAVSAEAVRHRIRQLIDAEDPKKVLSDDKLVELLRAEGMEIARRTVAKYREAMGIPSSVQRRREKKMLAG